MAAQKFPEPTVGALIVNPKRKIFLMKSHKWHDSFTLPGGHIELGETIEQAVKREIKEETKLDVFDIKFLCMHDFVFEKTFWKKKHFIFLIFSCKTESNEVKLNREAQEYTWATIPEAYRLPLEPYTKKSIEEYQRQLEEKKN